MKPTISVVLTCFNEGDYVGAAVRSVLDQTCSALIDSIAIVDDGSAPETIAVLDDVQTWDPRISVIKGSGGAGVAEARNIGVRQSTGEFIAFLDGDDVWLPKMLELQIGQFVDPAVGLCYTGYYEFTRPDYGDARLARVRDITRAKKLYWKYFLCDPPICPSGVMMRRAAFNAAGGFNPGVRVFEDTEFFFRVSRLVEFAVVLTPMFYKRCHQRSITSRRRSLMAHHAFVAFRAAEVEPSLLPLVPARLSERARKLANVEYRDGNIAHARDLFRLALRLKSTNLLAWMGLAATIGGLPLSSAIAGCRRRFSQAPAHRR
jgi:glycosyltransferase involved in cell wall biosynthesis